MGQLPKFNTENEDLNPFLQTVLLSIPNNKLPWIQEQAASETILLVLIKVEAKALVTEVVEVWLLVVWTLIWQLCEQAPKLQGFSSVQSCSSELSPQLSKVSQTNFSSMHLPKIENNPRYIIYFIIKLKLQSCIKALERLLGWI